MSLTQDLWPDLVRLAATAASPREFWSPFAAVLQRDLAAAQVVVLHRADPGQEWRPIATAAEPGAARRLGASEFVQEIGALATAVSAASTADDFPLARRYRGAEASTVVGAAVPLGAPATSQCVLLGLLPDSAEFDADAAQSRVRAAALLPSIMEARQSSRQAEADAEKLDRVLRVVMSAHGAERFGGAAQAVCNAVATWHGCDRVSLGWVEGGYAQLKAVSRQDQFDRKMELARRMEAAMDECLDQGEAITFPATGGGGAVTRDHAAFAAQLGDGVTTHVLTVPLCDRGKPVAALLCERGSGPFSEGDLASLQLAGEQVAPRLTELHARDRWVGARLVAWLRALLHPWLGPQHTLAKLAALGITAGLATLVFGRTDYRVEGRFLLRSDQVSNLSSPFDGYIKEVLVESGDVVTKGQVLLRLDTEALKVEESAAAAEEERYTREAEKARAARKVADMQIAESLARQARARLDVVRYRLAQSEIRSSLDGVLIEGDLKERLDAPVKQGDGLFRVARLGDFFVDIEIDERDAHLIAVDASGEAAFVTDPARKLPLRVAVVLPAAVEKEGVEMFVARARFQSPAEPWWRPGLSGVAKINAGKRSLLWIISHRTVDFLRLKLWW